MRSEFWLNHFEHHPSLHLIIQRQQWKHQSNFGNLLKGDDVINDIFLYIVNFEQVLHIDLVFPLLTLNK